MSDTNPTTPVRSAFDDPMNGTTAQDNTPKPSSSRQRRARSTSPASPSARGGRTGPNPESSLPPSATSSRGTSRSRQTRARTDSNTSDNIPDDDIKGFFDQGFSKMFHRSDALETKLDKLLESNKDLNKSLQGVTNSIEGMATSIVDTLKLRTSGEQPKPNSEGQSSGKQPKPNSEGQSSDNTPPRQPTNPSQSSSNVWAEPVPSPPDRTPSHRNPQNVERSREIRDWVKELMGPDNVLLINVSKEEADSFAPLYKENSLAIPFNNDEQFRLYLLGEPASAWNKGAATVFTNWLLDNQKIAPQNRYEVDAIRTAFLAHIRFLHSKYVQSSKTLEEQDRKARKQTVDARKRNTYNMRGEAINLFEALQRFRKLWNILGVDGTSSDEEVLIEGQRQYQILNLHLAQPTLPRVLQET
ncbi:hypothetical protein BT96DRAFT_992313 [Gymnopus androsaceus JB14]|uniref:Uncharacterized protein n=1 Tax=Gymnopus androsaceus JB14 TaxID=1447944 RepID=A0A6A4HVG7_9AGAR|nr:hypothetical protein BT96DRAFT_992313 [Gymnopus androsaceus JB14]